jgi:2-keto-4-pentenoate hydratase
MLRATAVARYQAAEAAKLLLEARAAHSVIALEAWKHAPSAESEAHAAQEEFVKLGGFGRRIGWKIGATNQGARDALKLQQPFYGQLFDSLATTQVAGPVLFPAGKFYQRVIEPEIALVMAEAVDASKGPVTADMIRAATARVVPAIEIVDSCFGAKWKEAGGLSITAENGAHGRFILGGGHEAAPAGFDATGIKVEIAVNGKVEREGTGAAVDGGAFEATAWLANQLALRGISLIKGDIITTGSASVPWIGNAGEEIVARFDGLGEVSIRFE